MILRENIFRKVLHQMLTVPRYSLTFSSEYELQSCFLLNWEVTSVSYLRAYQGVYNVCKIKVEFGITGYVETPNDVLTNGFFVIICKCFQYAEVMIVLYSFNPEPFNP